MAVTKHERRMQRKRRQQREEQAGARMGGEDQEDAAREEATAASDSAISDDGDAATGGGGDRASGEESGARGAEKGVEEDEERAVRTSEMYEEDKSMQARRGEAASGGSSKCVPAEDAVMSGPLVCGDGERQVTAHDNGNDAPVTQAGVDTPPISVEVNTALCSDKHTEVDLHHLAVTSDGTGQGTVSHSAVVCLSTVVISAERQEPLSSSSKPAQLYAGAPVACIDGVKLAAALLDEGKQSCDIPKVSNASDPVDSSIEQLKRDIQLLLGQKRATTKRQQDQSFTPRETTSSPAPSILSSTDATESLDPDHQNDRDGTSDSEQEARIHQLEAEIARAERRADALEAEKVAWTEAAEMQQDYRSQLLAAQVEKRSLGEKLRRIVESIDGGTNVFGSASQASFAELQKLVAVLCHPGRFGSNYPCAVELSDSLVFPAQHETERGRRTTTAWSWLWSDPNSTKDEYALNVMRLQEVPLKRKRSDSDGESDSNKPKNVPPTQKLDDPDVLGQLHSPQQLKRSRIEDINSDSSDEEEFVCHVDPTGKVSAIESRGASEESDFLSVL